jgi:hypothetical protein
MFSNFRNGIFFWIAPRLRLFVLVKWVWSICGMILTGKGKSRGTLEQATKDQRESRYI